MAPGDVLHGKPLQLTENIEVVLYSVNYSKQDRNPVSEHANGELSSGTVPAALLAAFQPWCNYRGGLCDVPVLHIRDMIHPSMLNL